MMRATSRCIGLLLIALIGALPASAPAAERGVGSAIVWRVTGTAGTIFLAGSIHVLRPTDYPLPEAYETAWAASDTLYMEIDPAVMTDPAAVQPYLSMFMDPDGRSLDEQLLSAGDRRMLTDVRHHATALGVDLDQLQPFRPWYAAINVMQFALLRAGYDPSWGVDQRLGARALAENRPAFGLETIGEQLGILAGLSPTQEAEFLLGTLKEASELEEQVGPMLAAWHRGDARALAATLDGAFEGFPELERKLLRDRNARWFQELRPLLSRSGHHMVVVGALHLVGDGGLVEMFRRAGYHVEQL